MEKVKKGLLAQEKFFPLPAFVRQNFWDQKRKREGFFPDVASERNGFRGRGSFTSS